MRERSLAPAEILDFWFGRPGEPGYGQPRGEWFRKDGSRMRSGSFEKGVPVGEWTTYDARGRIVKVTQLKRKKP